MSFWDKLERIDRRWIFTVLILVLVSVQLWPVGLALQVNDTTKKAYQAIDSLPAGSLVYFGCDYEPAGGAEIEPAAYAFFRHAMRKNLRVVAGGMWPQSGMMADRLIKALAAEFPDKKYGIDYINVGYRPGDQVFLSKMVENFGAALLNQDHYGKPLTDFTIMKDITSIKNFKLIVGLIEGDPGMKDYLKVVTEPHKIPFIISLVAVSVGEAMPFYSSGQVKGLLMGMRGAAEYEKLIAVPGFATAGMDAQSFVHLAITIFIVVGNLGYYLQKRRKSA